MERYLFQPKKTQSLKVRLERESRKGDSRENKVYITRLNKEKVKIQGKKINNFNQ